MPDLTLPPTVLAVDISSGGLSAAIIDSSLKLVKMHEEPWTFDEGITGAATLAPMKVLTSLTVGVNRVLDNMGPPRAMILSSMMHTLLIRDRSGYPKTPIFTWLDSQGSSFLRKCIDHGDMDIRGRTGIQYHPMFPLFKVLWLRDSNPSIFEPYTQLGSVKNYLIEHLVGESVEDIGTASSSGLLNIETGLWDTDLLGMAGLSLQNMPRLVAPHEIAGHLRPRVADALSLPHHLPVIAGSGDGFLANLGVGSEGHERITITLGTTAGVRKLVDRPHIDRTAGTFCYRFDHAQYLVGCASNNGGNVIEWSTAMLGPVEQSVANAGLEPPLFIPFLRGERSPFWNENLSARWYEIRANHDIHHLRRAVMEGLAFHLALYCELVDRVSGKASSTAVLSGNGFGTLILSSILATVIPQQTLLPSSPGLATLRGAARVGFTALQIETARATEEIMQEATIVPIMKDDTIERRFERFKDAYWQTGARPEQEGT